MMKETLQAAAYNRINMVLTAQLYIPLAVRREFMI